MRYIMVEPGDMAVGANDLITLETLLGSCVGLGLYDPEAKVGGIIHILLPDGPEQKTQENPLYYATSGIPALIEALEDLGGSTQRMKAHIAGGAHIVSKGILPNLNIGERNVIRTKELLDLYGIPILMADVGGSIGRRLKLELPDGKVEIRRSRPTSFKREGENDASVEEFIMPDKEYLKKAAQELKPDSKVAIRALQLLGSDIKSLKELEELILKDQVLAGRVLGIVNSARYGLSRQITKISHAVSLLGTRTFKKIVMQACIQNLYSNAFQSYDIDDQAFFHHAVASAELAQFMADQTNKVDPEEVYLATLMHDIGKILMERHFTTIFYRIKMSVAIDKVTFLRAERQHLGTDHAELGRFIADSWGLPTPLKDAIAFHHEPQLANGSHRELVGIVHVANFICNMLGIGLGSDTMSNELDAETLTMLGLDEKNVSEIVEYVPQIIYVHSTE